MAGACDVLRFAISYYTLANDLALSESSERSRFRRRLILLAAAMGLIWLTLAYPWPLAVRFHMSRAALTDAVVSFRDRGEIVRFQSVGWLFVENIRRDPFDGTILVQLAHDRNDRRYGLLWAPQGPTQPWWKCIAPGWYVR